MKDHGAFSSPPCMAAEVDPTYFDPLGTDPEQARDVARWRKAARTRLAGLREALDHEARSQLNRAIAGNLTKALGTRGIGPGMILSGFWPTNNEPDLRPLMSDLHRTGVTIALPSVERQNAPLVFRRWTPETKLIRDNRNIPVPPPEAEDLTPDVMAVPCLGWDADCFSLGSGGGYVDRTLAALAPRPITIGIALSTAQLTTIYPQPHDMPFDLMVTETGVLAERKP